jgi:hypothetical protein
LGFAALALLMLSQGAINGWLLLQLFDRVPDALSAEAPMYSIAVGAALCTCVLVTLIALDIYQRRRYDWLHWAGILLSLALAVNQWVRFAKEIFFTPR